MNTQDFLNIFLIAGLIIITVCIVYTSYYFVQALKSITVLTEDLEETTRDIKDKLQMKVLTAIPALLVALAARIIKKKRG